MYPRSRTPRNEKRIAPTPPHPPPHPHIVRPFIHPSSTAQAKPGGWRRCHRQPTPRGRRAPAPRRHRPQRQSRRRFLQVTRRRDRRERPGRARRSTAAPDARGRVHHQSWRVRREHRARPGARLRRANRAPGRRRAGRMGQALRFVHETLGSGHLVARRQGREVIHRAVRLPGRQNRPAHDEAEPRGRHQAPARGGASGTAQRSAMGRGQRVQLLRPGAHGGHRGGRETRGVQSRHAPRVLRDRTQVPRTNVKAVILW